MNPDRESDTGDGALGVGHATDLVVLRFRDIEVELGETVRQHRLIINSLGFCWWGWLFRDFESNPSGTLQGIMEATRPPFDVALYDTGQGLIYRATCEAIATSDRPGRSPSLDHTPPYYRKRNAPAWFKFVDISVESAEFVVGRTCVSMPSASDECFVDLEGKAVGRLRDLRRQEVTMWILGSRTVGAVN